jgi:hypothetical protein
MRFSLAPIFNVFTTIRGPNQSQYQGEKKYKFDFVDSFRDCSIFRFITWQSHSSLYLGSPANWYDHQENNEPSYTNTCLWISSPFTIAENVQIQVLISEFGSSFEAKIIGIHNKFNHPPQGKFQ